MYVCRPSFGNVEDGDASMGKVVPLDLNSNIDTLFDYLVSLRLRFVSVSLPLATTQLGR